METTDYPLCEGCGYDPDEGRLDCEVCGYGKEDFGRAIELISELAENGFIICTNDHDREEFYPVEDEDLAVAIAIICEALSTK